MRIEGDTIFFKSEDWVYELERNGKKPNTVRVLDYKDAMIVESSNAPKIISIKKVLIDNIEIESFKRDLMDISIVGHLLGKSIVAFSWRHEEE